MNDTSKVMIAALAGAAAGATAAILYTPKSGKETREDISKKYDELRENVNEIAQKGKKAASDAVEKVSNKATDSNKSTAKKS